MVIGPGNPADRVKMLREAYAGAMRDPGLVDEARKSQMDMEYTAGEELQSLMKDLMNQPGDVMARVQKILAD
jgi:tripartite-type tricarboxylate transporter receptor subunit TctC